MNDLRPGDLILVRSPNPPRDGFVADAGRFMRFERDGRFIVYDWCGLVTTRNVERVRVERRTSPFRFY